MYRSESVLGATPVAALGLDGRFRIVRALRFATVDVDQAARRSSRQSDVGPIGERIAIFQGRPDDARCDEGVERRRSAPSNCPRRPQFRNDSAVGRYGDELARFDSPNVQTQVVLEVPDP